MKGARSMSENVLINDKNIRNKSVAYFLETVLDICDELVSHKKTQDFRFYVSAKEDLSSLKSSDVLVYNENFSIGSLFRKVYQAIADCPHNGDNIYFFKHGKDRPETNIEIKFSKISYNKLNCKHTEKLRDFCKRLESCFLMFEDKFALISKLNNLIDERYKIDEQIQNTPFLDEDILEKYVRVYYDVLLLLFQERRVYSTQDFIMSQGEDTLLYLLLNLDTTSSNNNTNISLLSPIALCNVQKMYDLVRLYIEESVNFDENKVLRYFYRDVVVKKSLYAFRWYTTGNTATLMHATVAPYTENISGDLNVSVRDLNDYNSFAGICELRLAEKIKYEVEKSIEACPKKDTIRIAILGDLNLVPLCQLCQYVYQITNIDNKVKLVFNAYSKNLDNIKFNRNKLAFDEETSFKKEINNLFIEKDIELNTYSCLDKIFNDAETLSKILKNNDTILMLDCTKLYLPLAVQVEPDIEILEQKLSFYEPLDHISDLTNPCSLTYLEKLYELMVNYNQSDILGTFEKSANDTLLKFCEDFIENKTTPSTLFVYVSDLSAFRHLYCNNQYYVRVENYSEKEIGIIRFTNRDDMSVERRSNIISASNEYKIIAFNAWQFIKHLCLEKVDKILDSLNEDIQLTEDNKIHKSDLHKYYFCLDYSQGFNNLTIFTGVENQGGVSKERILSFLNCFIDKIIMPIFNSQNGIFHRYFDKAIYSMLYGNSKNMNDMLFIHLFRNRRGELGKLQKKAPLTSLENVTNYINYKYKYSIKRFIELMMRANDIRATESFEQIRVARIVDSNEKSNIGALQLYGIIADICEKLNYTDSYLYKNCKRKSKRGD